MGPGVSRYEADPGYPSPPSNSETGFVLPIEAAGETLESEDTGASWRSDLGLGALGGVTRVRGRLDCFERAPEVAERSPKHRVFCEERVFCDATPSRYRLRSVSNRVALVSSSSTAVTYRVPTSSYSIVVTVDHPCWLVVKSASSSSLLVATTLSPTASPMSIPVHGSASITVSARTQSIAITDGAKVLKTINAPVLGIAYTFLPAS